MSETTYYPDTPGNDDNPCSPDILDQHDHIKAELAPELIDTVPNPAFILNKDRRIIFYNQSLAKAVGEKRENMILGRRPGELLRCCNTRSNWCGDATPCVQCGALRAIQTAMSGQKSEEECMLLANVDGKIKAYTFMVNSSPIKIKGDEYYIIHLTDISDSKHKEMMERVFLHDLLNAVNGIANAGTLIKIDAIKKEQQELAGMIVERAHYMANEINAHRLFISAEAKQLETDDEPVAVVSFIESICAFYENSQLAKEKNISINSKINEFKLTTDKRILYRILENLVKNAFEASPENGTVSVEAREENNRALFTISNQGTIPMTVAHQIFKRSFSTKGPGRGLGTYSVKMFTENYLRGRVWFDSSKDDGTNFYVEIPLSPSERPLGETPCPSTLQA
ncbi:PAS domain-containing sensor histidine kinase [Desulfovibrio sp. JC010]|uniref:sensor histidine kinase n=1 Tax=Desulfovibrio sp. JC010 TaxID=2593641 RepID=UPI0013D83EC0|nr:PAS domain-containing sensor histidine kinase [Desulfovibrio sp. JC010]NDV27447.1 PAS domain-containing sensor histidine kinase [Desulfovibrio sp. JC010]